MNWRHATYGRVIFFWRYSRHWVSPFSSHFQTIWGQQRSFWPLAKYDEIEKVWSWRFQQIVFSKDWHNISHPSRSFSLWLCFLHQQVESNSPPLKTGHFLVIHLYHRIQSKWYHMNLKYESDDLREYLFCRCSHLGYHLHYWAAMLWEAQDTWRVHM